MEGLRDRPIPNLYGLDRPALDEALRAFGARPFATGQLYRWLYARGRLDPECWTDLPRSLRERIGAGWRVEAGRIEDRASAEDGTIKYRVGLPGGGSVESVAMEDRGRVTLCLSTQVGCALDCDFCLTGRMGLLRHLTPGEIVGQAALIREDRNLEGSPFNVVFMGMGEPLHNYDGTLASVRILTDQDGFGLSRRRITVSTAGMAPEIERLAREPLRPRLAISLNATRDALRDRIMPINRRYPLARLLGACREFCRATGERISFEYVLLDGVNDADAQIDELGKIVRAQPAKLNLIPFNAVPGWLPYRAPPAQRVHAIRDRLLAAGVPVSVRWSRGAGARAACGQLALLPDTPPDTGAEGADA